MANAPPDEFKAAARSGAADAANASASASSSGAMRPPPWLGKQVGRFKLVSLLGKGAYGRVFLAQDVDLQRQVALKVITAEAIAKRIKADAASAGESHRSLRSEGATQAVESLIREARAAARIEHPNVVQIYEVGRLHGNTSGGYIAMELLEGGTLHDLVKAAGPLDVARACAMVADAAEALQYGHDLGVVHRDVKPGNLMLSRIGRCKVADFGLACIDDPADSHRYLPIVGTAHYMAPEVIRGGPPDPRSDQYSLAATLYMILTGHPPYRGENRRKVLEAHLEAPLPDLRKARPDADQRLSEVIRRAMSKDPAQRFPNIRQLGVALRLFTVSLGDGGSAGTSVLETGVAPGIPQRGAAETAGEGEQSSTSTSFASGISAAASGPGGLPRQKWPWIAGGAAILLLVVAGLVFMFAGGGPEPEESEDSGAPVTPAKPTGDGVEQIATFVQPEARYVGYPTDVEGTVTHVPADPSAGHDGASRLSWNFADLSRSEAAWMRIEKPLRGRPSRVVVRARSISTNGSAPYVQFRVGLRDANGVRQLLWLHDGEMSTEWKEYSAEIPAHYAYPLVWEDVYVVRVEGHSEYTATGAIEVDTLSVERGSRP